MQSVEREPADGSKLTLWDALVGKTHSLPRWHISRSLALKRIQKCWSYNWTEAELLDEVFRCVCDSFHPCACPLKSLEEQGAQAGSRPSTCTTCNSHHRNRIFFKKRLLPRIKVSQPKLAYVLPLCSKLAPKYVGQKYPTFFGERNTLRKSNLEAQSSRSHIVIFINENKACS